MIEDPFATVRSLDDLTRRTFTTPGAGRTGRPFRIVSSHEDGLEVQTSKGGRVALRAEAFQGALKVLKDLGAVEDDGWVRVSDETLVAVLQSENRDKACASYVLPLLEASGLIELARTRPARARLVQGAR